MRRLLCGLSVCLALAGALAASASAQTWQAPCVDGTEAPLCSFWTGYVRHVADGDTIVADLGDRVERVRIAGMQAMEQTVYSRDRLSRQGFCHALEATARLEELVMASGGRVRLSAQDPASRSGRRWRRSAAVLLGGQWVDVASTMIAEGHALWLPNGREWAWNERDSLLAQQAAAQGAGLWNTEYCGGGPPAALKVWVNSNAPGDDAQHPDGEWIRVKNTDPAAPIDLGGWWLRDSGLHRFTFAPGSVVGPLESVKVHVGTAPDGGLSFGLGEPLFENADPDGRGRGDGVYLFDPEGDLRAWQQYPCRYACADPYGGVVELRALPRADAVTIRNTGTAPIDLDGTRLSVRRRAQEVGPGAIVGPGETLRVDVGWLRNAGDVVLLDTYDKIPIACAAWGDATC
ncbi:MAG TPA: lamin tail domain-containing protein [Capillimicrobium sp.]|nr:lamin tail domain-containing protein [Capillimicrobium sp.]